MIIRLLFFKINSWPRLHSTINFFSFRTFLDDSSSTSCYKFKLVILVYIWCKRMEVRRFQQGVEVRIQSLQVGPSSPHCIFFSYPSTYGEASKDNISFNSLVYGFSFHIHWYNRYTLKIWSIHFSILLYVLTNLSLLFWNWKGLEETWCGCSSVKKSVVCGCN